MLVIVKLHPEIFVKSRSLRKRHLKLLVGNIRQIMKRHELNVIVENRWDKLTVQTKKGSDFQAPDIIARLQNIPGIDKLQKVTDISFDGLSHAADIVSSHVAAGVVDKTFWVKVKRKGQHTFTSVEAGREIGAAILRKSAAKGVQMKAPDVVVDVLINDNRLVLVDSEVSGIGGYPMPSQGNVVSLISGGFDSAVASYQMMRRGARVHFCFFNLAGSQHQIAVEQVVSYLWQQYGASHKSRLVSVNFDCIVEQILERVDSGIMGVVLKRMMLRAAAIVAKKLKVDAIVTGESVGQVSSQTMANLSVIDQVTEQLILRPLVCTDKQDIIDLARIIGVEDLVKSIPEYCGVISQKPTVNAQLDQVLAAEALLDSDLVERAIQMANVDDVGQINSKTQKKLGQIDSTRVMQTNDTVIDVRAPQEAETRPLSVAAHDVVCLPFYKLQSAFPDLPKSQHYYLYCERGVMSQLQVLLLQELGFDNVHVYLPTEPV